MALITQEGEDFSTPNVSPGTVQEGDPSLLLLPYPKPVTPTTSWSRAITWAKMKKLIFLTVYWFPVLLCEDKTFHSPILPQNTCQIALLLHPTIPKTQIMKSWQSTWREHLLLSTAWGKKAEINKHSEGWSLLNCHQNSLKPFCANTGTAKLPVDRAGSCVEHTGCRKTGKKPHWK